MKFTITHSRDVTGNRIVATVQADPGNTITEVVTELDGSTLGRDTLNPAETQYTRTFPQAGTFTPGRHHVTKVTATDSAGQDQTASDRWDD